MPRDLPPLPKGYAWLAGAIRTRGYAASIANFLQKRDIPVTVHLDPLGKRQAGLAVRSDQLDEARELLQDGVDLELIEPENTDPNRNAVD